MMWALAGTLLPAYFTGQIVRKPMPLEIGTRIGDYEILSVLGAGGMGQVYSARNIISGRIEAMKVLLPDFAAEPELATRFTAEIRILAGLEHPNIAQLRTAFRFENRLVMVMEFVEGVTLEKRASESPIPLDDILNYSSQVLAALSYAHSKGVTHRDIKPANIMITSHGQVKLMDFGIAKSTTDLQLTRPGTTMGSVYYMSPEQVRGGTVDARSDVYSFGVTLYEMLTGRRPFQADTAYTVLNAQLNEAPQPLTEINPSIPPELNNIVLRAMVKAPEGRFQTADDFRAALRAFKDPASARSAQPVPAAATPAAASVAAPKAAKGRRGLWIGLGAAAALVAVILAATFLPRIFSAHAGQGTPAATASDAPAQSASTSTDSAQQATSTSQPDSSNPLATAAPMDTADSSSMATPPQSEPVTATRMQSAPTSQQTIAATETRAPHASQRRGASPARNISQAAPPPADNPPPPGPSLKEIAQARDRMIQLGAQADAAQEGVQQIRSVQQAQGLDLRGDILGSMNRMNAYINEANSALQQNDLKSANSYMDRADRELSTLNTFLGH